MIPLIGEHQYELMDSVAAKFHEEPGVFKLMVCANETAAFQLFLHFYKVKTKVCIGPSGP